VFGVLCLGAAIQAYFTYPETAQKSVEEIEILFRKGGPKPWQTRVGESRLDAEIELLRERKQGGEDVRAFSVDSDGVQGRSSDSHQGESV
jgi:hypothetical protein